MCLICSEIYKEELKPQEFWDAYREITGVNPNHIEDIIKAVSDTSLEYQTKLASSAFQNYE